MIKTFLRYYLPLLVWAWIIFYFSSIPDLQLGTGVVSEEIIVRKLAHTIEYAILFWLIFRLFSGSYKMSLPKALVWSLVFSVIYAASDEFHQTFVVGRSGRLADVIFDAVSALLGLQLLAIIIRRKIKLYYLVLIFITMSVLLVMEFDMIKEGERMAGEKKIELNDGSSSSAGNISEESQDSNQPEEGGSIIPDKTETIKAGENSIPDRIFIKVPFTTQAPFANWDKYHEEACEEAALIMVKYYLDKKTLNPELTEKEIQGLIKFETKKYGDYRDSTAQEIVKMASDYYNIKNLQVIYDIKPDDLKKYLANGTPIIVPAAGRKLGNPNFTAPGPLYHNLVIVGYEGNMIITNDPGTRKGEGYKYDINTLYNAIHDFPGKPEEIEKGRKAIIVVK